ncbi:hypothetical protein ACFV4N_32110 [Actinosynnema sp. NPDC059797]
MIGRKVRLALVGGLAVAALVGGPAAAQAQAQPQAQVQAQTQTQARTETAAATAAGASQRSADVVGAFAWRGGYSNHYDCDLAGYRGILNGWWTTYLCSYRLGSSPAIWDLYA